MIKRVNVYQLQQLADHLPRVLKPESERAAKELIGDAIHEICEWRDAMRKINSAALDALTEPGELKFGPPKPKLKSK